MCSSSHQDATAGTTNTGGGGGGGGGGAPKPGGQGGSGVVIVKEPGTPKSAPGVWSMNTVFDLVKGGEWVGFNATRFADYLVSSRWWFFRWMVHVLHQVVVEQVVIELHFLVEHKLN